MKTIVEVRDSIVRGVLMERNMGDTQIDQILREYAESIVQACADNFECTLEEIDYDDDSHGEYMENYSGKRCYPVLVRASIETVKSQIH